MTVQSQGIGIRTHSGGIAGTARALPHAVFQVWLERYRTRSELARLLRVGPHMIDDIGLDPAVVEAEAAKRFWQE